MSGGLVLAVSGEAGSGKTTLGRALARTLALPLIDLDSVTVPLLDALPTSATEGHWLSSPSAERIREGRYAAVRAVIADIVAAVGGAVVVAPFTAELAGGPPWRSLQEAAAPAEVRMLHLRGEAELFAGRRAARGAPRDEHRRADAPVLDPAIPVLTVEAELTTAQQVSRLLPELGRRHLVDADAALLTRRFDAVLFDLDGTLVDSTASVTRSWRRFAAHYGVSADALHANHGQPARALVGRLLPGQLHAEGLAHVTDLEVADAAGLVPVRGAAAFYASVPTDRRAVVTSGTVPIATARLGAAGFDAPEVLVTADIVEHGKPHPEPFLTAARLLDVDPGRCLVVEDAVAGITAARAAGCAVLAVTGTVDIDDLRADLVVDGLDRVAVVAEPDGLRLRLT